MPKTYNELYLEVRKAFRDADIAGYNIEARYIAAFASGKTPDNFVRDLSLYASREVETKLGTLVARRLDGEPLAYIMGSWQFYGLPIIVAPGVLIPRMDTEVLVDTAIKQLRIYSPAARILDLCAGTGCIGCAIAVSLPETRVVLVDSSERALKIARRNIALNALEERAVCIAGDVRKEPPAMLGSFDLVVCNPPYIPTAEISRLERSVKDFEPKKALDGGKDGLNLYRAVLKNWKGVFREGACLMFETGAGASEEVRKLMHLNGFKGVCVVDDTGGIPRVAYGHI